MTEFCIAIYLLFLIIFLITSSVGVVAKYCDEHACVCVCVSVCPRAYLRNHRHDLYQFSVHDACGRGSVLLRQGDEIPRGKAQFWWLSEPFKSIGNLLCSCHFRICCRRDHLVANNIMQYKGSFSMPG